MIGKLISIHTCAPYCVNIRHRLPPAIRATFAPLRPGARKRQTRSLPIQSLRLLWRHVPCINDRQINSYPIHISSFHRYDRHSHFPAERSEALHPTFAEPVWSFEAARLVSATVTCQLSSWPASNNDILVLEELSILAFKTSPYSRKPRKLLRTPCPPAELGAFVSPSKGNQVLKMICKGKRPYGLKS